MIFQFRSGEPFHKKFSFFEEIFNDFFFILIFRIAAYTKNET